MAKIRHIDFIEAGNPAKEAVEGLKALLVEIQAIKKELGNSSKEIKGFVKSSADVKKLTSQFKNVKQAVGDLDTNQKALISTEKKLKDARKGSAEQLAQSKL